MDSYKLNGLLTDVYKGLCLMEYQKYPKECACYISSYFENGKKIYTLRVEFIDNSKMKIEFKE